MPVFIPWAPAGLWDVGGIAGQEDTAGAVAGGVAVVESEVRWPNWSRSRKLPPVKASAIACRSVRAGSASFLVVLAARRAYPEHSPGRRPGEREEEEHAAHAQEGMPDVALEVAVNLEVAEGERSRISATFERDSRAVADVAMGAVAADQVEHVDALSARRRDAMCRGPSSPASNETISTPRSKRTPCSARCSFSNDSVSAWETKSRNG